MFAGARRKPDAKINLGNDFIFRQVGDALYGRRLQQGGVTSPLLGQPSPRNGARSC
jgi:hypothetical protein